MISIQLYLQNIVIRFYEYPDEMHVERNMSKHLAYKIQLYPINGTYSKRIYVLTF